MRCPQRPPDFKALILSDPLTFERLQPLLSQDNTKYYHWDKLRRLPPPPHFSHLDWWAAIKIGRLSKLRPLSLMDCRGRPFFFSIPDEVALSLHQIDLGAGGRIGMPEQVTNPQTRDQYLVNSLMQEAITSSQLEGAVTTREVARDMLRTGRAPRDKSEKMILNNFLTMRRIIELRGKPLTADLVCEIHKRVTEGTLANPEAAGRFRLQSENVEVVDNEGEILHTPPDAIELERRVDEMCRFANGETPGFFVHPVIRAILLHFWLAYDHPFVDGNGRTARALFYWSMLRQNYWLFEFISISDILRKAPSQYARSFLYTETDDNDTTYFIVHQIRVIESAIKALHEYIEKKSDEVRNGELLLRAWDGLNHRQIALMAHATRHPSTTYTIDGHRTSHNTAYDTARKDLLGLAKLGLLTQGKRGKELIFRAPKELNKVLEKRGSDGA